MNFVFIWVVGYSCSDVKSLYKQNNCCNNTSLEVYDFTTTSFDAYNKYNGFNLIFADEFDTFNASIWTNEFGDSGWGNQELQFYKNTVKIKNGMAHLEVKRNGNSFESSRIMTKYKKHFRRGIIEARIKLPKLGTFSGNGLWPAFWMLGANIDQVGWPACGEVDILEAGYGFQNYHNKLIHAIHYGNDHQYDSTISNLISAIDDDFHTFTLKWSDSEFQWLLDDNLSWKFDITESKYDVFRENDFFLILNVAVGGKFPGIFNPTQIELYSTEEMIIDWIRAYEAN